MFLLLTVFGISIIIYFDNTITPFAFDNDNASLKSMNHDKSDVG